jgi:UDP-N-acetylglucosamine acyltransferase
MSAAAMTNIHPTAVIDPSAKVPASCKIGPYCVIGADVELGEECELVAHVVLQGPTKLGSHNKLFPFAAIGIGPQDLSYKGEPTRLEIGNHNQIREYVTIHRGTIKGGGLTVVGNHTLIMAYAHVAHDCQIGDHVILANGATLGGHVTVEEYASISALCPIHQFVTIGKYSYVGGGTTITQDVLPFSKTSAAREVHAYGVNSVGLERRGFTPERIKRIQHFFKVLLASKLNTSQAITKLKSEGDLGEDVAMLLAFVERSERGVIK